MTLMLTGIQPDLKRRLTCLALLGVVLAVTFLSAPITSAQETNPPMKGIVHDSEARTIDPLWTTEGCRSVVGAFTVGLLGAAAFCLGVFCGFISRESRERLLEHLADKETGKPKIGVVFLFCAFGGVVAAVFQAAQASIFAPIQALVLGATWPSVVTRIMSGNDSSPGLAPLGNLPPNQIPTPKSRDAVVDAQVVIKRRTN